MQIRAARPDRDSAGGSSGQINRVATHSGSSRTNKQINKQTNWHFILTDDEFWFFHYTANSRIWFSPDAEIPKVAQRLINKPKIMVIVFWNISGLYVSKFLENGTSFNSVYFTDYVFIDIECLPALQTAVQQKKKFVLHMDNSPVHKSRAVTEKVVSLPLALAFHRNTRRIWHRLTSFSSDT
jgi:hypothetical protein